MYVQCSNLELSLLFIHQLNLYLWLMIGTWELFLYMPLQLYSYKLQMVRSLGIFSESHCNFKSANISS